MKGAALVKSQRARQWLALNETHRQLDGRAKDTETLFLKKV